MGDMTYAEIIDTERWTRDVNGYAICPCCGSMVHQRMVDFHVEGCYGIQRHRFEREGKSAPTSTEAPVGVGTHTMPDDGLERMSGSALLMGEGGPAPTSTEAPR